jgi:hypothetical protein
MIKSSKYPSVELSVVHCAEGGCRCVACNGSQRRPSFELVVRTTQHEGRGFQFGETRLKKLIQTIASELQGNKLPLVGESFPNRSGDEAEIKWFLEPVNRGHGDFILKIVESKPNFPEFNGQYFVSEKNLREFVREAAALKYSSERFIQKLREKEIRQEVVKTYMSCLSLRGIRNEIEPFLTPLNLTRLDSQIVDILLTATFITGPSVAGIATHTGHSSALVNDVARRMQDSGLWTRHQIEFDHWFDEDLAWRELEFRQDCEIACGNLLAVRSVESRGWSRVESRRSEKDYASFGFRGEEFQRFPFPRQLADEL